MAAGYDKFRLPIRAGVGPSEELVIARDCLQAI
jgi:hypothetical protein